MDAKTKMQKAKNHLLMDSPFFGSLVCRLKFREQAGLGSPAATDGLSLFYDPALVDKLSLAQCQFLIAHEALHCANGHPFRIGGREMERWNTACDYAINPILKDAAVGEWIDGALLSDEFAGLAAEAIYNRLSENPPDASGATGTFTEPPPGAGNPNPQQDPQQNPGQAPPPPQAPPQGGGDQEPEPDSDGDGEQDQPQAPPPRMSQAELAKLDREWKTALAQANQTAKAAGRHSEDMERFTRERLNSRVDWLDVMRAFLLPDKSDYSWSRPNRRHVASGLYLPSLAGESMQDIVCAVDTSGSVSPEDLEQAAGEFSAILEEFPSTRIHVVYCDAAVRGYQEFTAENLPVTLQARGGGGTAFAPVFDWVREQGLDPAALVYFSDLLGPDCEPPDYPVLWIDSFGAANRPPGYGPSFGDIVPINP